MLNCSRCICHAIVYEKFSIDIQLDIPNAAKRMQGFTSRFRVLGRVFGVAPSTVCRWHSLRHRCQDDSRRTRARARKLTHCIIQCKRRNLLAYRFLMRSVLKLCILQVFNPSGSRQLLGTAFRAAGLTTKSSASSLDNFRISSCGRFTDLVVTNLPRFAVMDATAFDCSTTSLAERASRGFRRSSSRKSSWARISIIAATSFFLSSRHRFPQRERRGIGIAGLGLKSGFSFRCSLHRG